MVDVIKMHGRSSPPLFKASTEFIKNYAQGNKELLEGENDLLKLTVTELNVPAAKINKWRQTIKNCQFECWNCNVCNALGEKVL